MNHEEKVQFAKSLSEGIQQAMDYLGDTLGAQLAGITPMGSMVTCGRQSTDKTKGWQIVLATNEAANELREWASKESKARAEAMKKLGPERGTAIYENQDNWTP